MGQYWKPYNLDKKEFIEPHQLGSGLKLWEQLANHPGPGAALIILLAVMPEARGGGDLEENNEVIGRWAGDRVVLIGDYAEDDDFPTRPEDPPFSQIYDHPDYTDITPLVAALIEKELDGKFVSNGWKEFKRN